MKTTIRTFADLRKQLVASRRAFCTDQPLKDCAGKVQYELSHTKKGAELNISLHLGNSYKDNNRLLDALSVYFFGTKKHEPLWDAYIKIKHCKDLRVVAAAPISYPTHRTSRDGMAYTI